MAGSTLISSLAFSDLVDTTSRIHKMGEYLVEDLAAGKMLYKVQSIPKHTGTERIHDEYDTETYAHLKIEGGDATKVAVIKGWTKTATMRRFAAEIDLTHEMSEFATSDAGIVNKMTSLYKYCPQRQALDLTHRFSFATSTSYTDMDGETVDVSELVAEVTVKDEIEHNLKFIQEIEQEYDEIIRYFDEVRQTKEYLKKQVEMMKGDKK